MHEKETGISLEILLLNDLLRTKAIDTNIYNKAVQRIASRNNEKQAASARDPSGIKHQC